MTDYVRKPIDPDALIAVLNRIASSTDDAFGARKTQRGADKEFTAIPLFDEGQLSSLRVLFGETESQVMIETTLDGAVALLGEIKSALQSNDLNSAKRTAHSLKGMASNWAADRISAIAQMLERDVTSLDQAEALAVHLDDALVDDALEATRALSAA